MWKVDTMNIVMLYDDECDNVPVHRFSFVDTWIMMNHDCTEKLLKDKSMNKLIEELNKTDHDK